MTALEAAGPPPEARGAAPSGARTSPRDRLAFALTAAFLLALWLLSHPYAGIIHDARLYVGRALADLDPGGLGRDLLFAHDGQSGFTVYRPMIRAGVTAFGAGPAALSATLVNLTLWFAAAAAFAAPFTRGRRLAAVLIAVAVIDSSYGGFEVFRYGEAFASPRPLAEAAVMLGLACLATGRLWLALPPMLAALVLHPVMALPGVMIAFLVHAERDRRLWALPVLGALALLAAAFLHLPLADRLLVTADPAWMAVMRARTPYLFALWWTPGDWGRTLVQFALVLIAALGSQGRLRRLLLSILAAAAVGLLATIVLCDGLHDILALQLQPWRALWPLTVVANGVPPLIALALWRRGARGRTALGLVVLAWLVADYGLGGATAAAACLGGAAWSMRGRPAPAERLAQAVLAIAGLAVLIETGHDCMTAARTLLTAPPPDSHFSLLSLWRSAAAGDLVLAGLALTAWVYRRRPIPHRLLTLFLLAAALPAALLWDDRTATERRIENGRPDPALAQALGPQPGAILWVGSDAQPWLLARRANWATSVQGASTVFSRDLAMAWDNRMRRLIALGFATEGDRRPFTPAKRIAYANTITASSTVCGWLDRPAAILIAGRRPIPGAFSWKPHPPEMRLTTDGRRFLWKAIPEYTVVRCPPPPAPAVAPPAISRPAGR